MTTRCLAAVVLVSAAAFSAPYNIVILVYLLYFLYCDCRGGLTAMSADVSVEFWKPKNVAMLVKEYRICLPLSVAEYRIAQLYMIQVSIVLVC